MRPNPSQSTKFPENSGHILSNSNQWMDPTHVQFCGIIIHSATGIASGTAPKTIGVLLFSYLVVVRCSVHHLPYFFLPAFYFPALSASPSFFRPPCKWLLYWDILTHIKLRVTVTPSHRKRAYVCPIQHKLHRECATQLAASQRPMYYSAVRLVEINRFRSIRFESIVRYGSDYRF